MKALMNAKNNPRNQKSVVGQYRKLRYISLGFIWLSLLFLGLGVGFRWHYILTICLVVGSLVIAFILPFTIRRIKRKRDMDLVKLMHIQSGYSGRL